MSTVYIRPAVYGGIGFLLLLLAWGSFFTVDQTELANIRRFGTVLYPTEPLGPGVHFKWPLIDTADVSRVTLQTIHIPAFDVLTVDNQKVSIEENFNYTIAKDRFYHVIYEVGSSGHIDADTVQQQIIPIARDRTARVFAGQNMITVNSNREAIQAQIEKDVTLAAESLFGITPHSLQIAAIKPSENFMHSIDQATMAKNAAVAAENQLRTKQFEAQQVAATAKGAADAQVEQARGQAESAKIVANAEKIRLTLTADGTAYARTTNAAAEAQALEATGLATARAVKAQAEALRSAPELTEWTKATRWDGKLPSQMFAGAPIPFLNIGK